MIRDDAGNPLASKDVEVSIAILKGGADGTEVFAETHQATTNEFGIVNLRIGSETIMEGINWGAGVYYIQVSVDGKIMGSSPLLSVPYAIHSASSADAFSGDYHDLAGAPDLAGFIYIDAPQDGDMIFFDEDEWQSLNQGDEGQVLTIVDGKPAWADLTPGGNGDDNTVTDIEGNVYQTVVMGNQEWMAENLRVSKYNNGSALLTNFSDANWGNTMSGAFAIYPHELVNNINSPEEMVAAYGKLYNWYAVNDSRGLCPAGWSVPSHDEWSQLVDYIVAQGFQNDDWNDPNGAANALKSCRQVESPLGGDCDTSEHPRWNSHDIHYGFDEFGFSALPGGWRSAEGVFDYHSFYSGWWSSTVGVSPIAARSWSMWHGHSRLGDNHLSKSYGYSVRCIRTLED